MDCLSAATRYAYDIYVRVSRTCYILSGICVLAFIVGIPLCSNYLPDKFGSDNINTFEYIYVRSKLNIAHRKEIRDQKKAAKKEKNKMKHQKYVKVPSIQSDENNPIAHELEKIKGI